MREDYWTCHCCGEERPDSLIDVMTFSLKDLPGAEINIRYCVDRPACALKAKEAGRKGEFPKRDIKKKPNLLITIFNFFKTKI